ncbi:MAG: D-xylose transport system permease protein, partial [Gaiellaceae bacterium]|nr:D-xylose transport system permease protein [Gaiellaceae bacterium]
MTSSAPDVAAPTAVDPEIESFGTRLWENIKGGNLGSAPVIVGLTIIVIVFSLTAQNFFTAVNLNNIITQMAGTTMLAFGVVFILLLGEIDLSIAFLSGIAGVVAAELQNPARSFTLPGILPIVVAVLVVTAIGVFQGSFVALIGVPAFVVTLAGLLAWQGVIQTSIGDGGPIIIEDRWINYTESYFFSKNDSWLIAVLISAFYVGGVLFGVLGQRRHGVAIRNPYLVVAR